MCLDFNRVTLSVKLADLQWEHRGYGPLLEEGAMGLLRWRDATDHTFEVLKYPWLKGYTAHTWEHI